MKKGETKEEGKDIGLKPIKILSENGIQKYVMTGKLLGEGSFGKVHVGWKISDQTSLIAIKVIGLKKDMNDYEKKCIQRELNIMTKVKSEYIVPLYDALQTEKNLYMIMELCTGGNLEKKRINKGNIFPEMQAKQYMKEIFCGFQALHNPEKLDGRIIMHRDIKPPNILLGKDEKAKITDFGLSRFVDPECEPQYFTRVGTLLYAAPQILEEHQTYTIKCDV